MYFKKFEDLTFADHYIFEKVLHENQDICKELLERLLKIKIDHIEYPEIEKTISPYYETKGVRLDVYLKDTDKVFDIELQNAIDFDLAFRTRYYQSMIDTDNLPTVDVINYSIKLAKYCSNHMNEITDYIYEKLRKRGGYIDELNKEEFIKKIGKPTIYDEYLNFGSISYLENTIDEHIITLEFNKFDFGYVSLNG